MAAPSQHEINYMPSHWSKRYGHLELLARYFKFCEQVTRETRSSVAHELNRSYGNSERMKYDLYGTNLPDDAPIFVFIHGGYWQEFSKDLSGFAVPNFVANGIKVVVAGYDLCPNVKLTNIVQQIKILVDKILTLAKSLGSKCVWVSGHSAGAHLVASLLHDSRWLQQIEDRGYRNLLKGLVLIAGVYALEPLLDVSVNEALKLTQDEIMSYTFAPLDESIKKEENTQSVCGLKVIILVGECDSPVFIEESRRYSRRLTKFVDNVELLVLRDNIDHFNIVENLTKSDFVLSKILIHNINSTY